VRRAAVVLLAAAAVAASAAPALGATSRQDTAVQLTLVRQPAWTPLGGTLTLSVHASGARPGLSLSIVAHSTVGSRSSFARSLGGDSLGSTVDRVAVPFDTLAPDSAGNRTVSVGLEVSGGPRTEDRLGLRRTGVYPLEVELQDDQDQTVARFVTYAVVERTGDPTPLTRPLGVAWVWPLSAAPATRPDGTIDPDVSAALQPGGRLGAQATALATNTDVPLTVVPGPETMEVWTQLGHDNAAVAAGASAVQAAAARDQMIPGTYVPVNVPSLLRAGLVSALDAQFVQGADALHRFFGTPVDGRTMLARPTDGAALARLRSAGVDRVIVPEASVDPGKGRFLTTHPFSLQPSSLLPGSVTAVASDGELEALLGGPLPPALRAQRFLAGLAVVALERPGDTRAVVVVNPDTFDAPPVLINAVLAGLRGNPWLTPMTTDQVFAQIPAETDSSGNAVTRDLMAYTPPAAPVSATAYTSAEARLSAFRAFVATGDPQVTNAAHALVTSVSSAWSLPGAGSRATDELAVVELTIDAFLRRIQVPNPATITLTSFTGDIPLTFRNDTGQTINVLLQLNSPQLTFPDGASRLVQLPPRSTTVRVAVESRTSGSFPLRLTVSSADGVLLIARAAFRVRSTAVSTVALVLMAGAALFLAVWWGLHIRRRRRTRAAAPAPAAPEGATG
jgi:uncharacterized protein DUF6049